MFLRPGARPGPVEVHLAWAPNPDPAFYTPRGTMREVSLTEGGSTVSVPAARLRAIEDLWPESVRLYSPRPGDYRLYLPYGVGEGPAHPDAVVVSGYRFVDLLEPAPEYVALLRPH